MPSEYQKRLKEVERLVRPDRDEVGKRAGVPFIVFPYNPTAELAVEKEITALIKKLDYHGQTVAEVDMRELVFTTLQDRDILDNVLEMERRDPDRLLQGLKSSLLDSSDMGELASRIAKRATDADTVIVYRMGILYPFTSASALMGRLEGGTPADTPIVFCYPATVDNNTLKFLDETEGQYYRAKVV